MKSIMWFGDVGLADVDAVGGKGANLGELTKANLPVPPGFVITSGAYLDAIGRSGARELLGKILESLDSTNSASLAAAAEECRVAIQETPIPADLAAEITAAYRKLGANLSVAVRSSGTNEDAGDTSFAGMNASFTNVVGDQDLLKRIVDCWASLFGERVIAYRAEAHVTDEPEIAVIVQEMIPSERSGINFTANPSTGETSSIVIEAVFGQGEAIVSGMVEPDTYIVAKDGLKLLSTRVGHKTKKIIRGTDGADLELDLTDAEADSRVLTDDEVIELAKIAIAVEAHYGKPQDMEWAAAGGKIYLVQSRPITTLHPAGEATVRVLLRGLAASAGRASGAVRVLTTPDRCSELLTGEILVAPMTSPDWVPAMRRAAALITDGGGMTCHAAIVSRELGVPAVVGARIATTALHDGQIVTVDGKRGEVYAGALAEEKAVPPSQLQLPARTTPPTATRLYANLAVAEHAEDVAAMPVDGVGLLRAELMVIEALGGTHPWLLIEEGRSTEFVERMADALVTFAAGFAPRPVTYRTIDFRTNEFRGLEGGDRFEPEESNPMIGYRGALRYTHEPEVFQLELEAVRRVWDEGHANFHVMLPFVRTARELEICRAMVSESGLLARRGFELWVMAEVPSVLFNLERYAALGIAGISIGSNDLTQLMLGADRDSELVAEVFDERDPAVADYLKQLIPRARALGLQTSICGQAPSVYPEYAELLVRCGIDAISVNVDVVDRTRRLVAAAEARLILDAARNNGKVRS